MAKLKVVIDELRDNDPTITFEVWTDLRSNEITSVLFRPFQDCRVYAQNILLTLEVRKRLTREK